MHPFQEVATPGFPLETEIWVEELLSHVFAVISNLDAPEHRGASEGDRREGCRGWVRALLLRGAGAAVCECLTGRAPTIDCDMERLVG